jgi:hypothetical protein
MTGSIDPVGRKPYSADTDAAISLMMIVQVQEQKVLTGACTDRHQEMAVLARLQQGLGPPVSSAWLCYGNVSPALQ